MNEYDKELSEAGKRLDEVFGRYCLNSWTQFIPSSDTHDNLPVLGVHMNEDEYNMIPSYIFNCPKEEWNMNLVKAWEKVHAWGDVVREDEYRDENGDVVSFVCLSLVIDLNTAKDVDDLCNLIEERMPDPYDDVCKCCRAKEEQEKTEDSA